MHLRSYGSVPCVPDGLSLVERVQFIVHSDYDTLRALRRVERQCHYEAMRRVSAASMIQKKWRHYYHRQGFGRKLNRLFEGGLILFNFYAREFSLAAYTPEMIHVATCLGRLHSIMIVLGFRVWDPEHNFAHYVPPAFQDHTLPLVRHRVCRRRLEF